MEPAPFYDDVADGPAGGRAVFARTSDGVRIRLGIWAVDGARNGTVLLFPGRTEYIEKYGPAAREFAKRGFASLAVDWRGQGLADRIIDDPMVGYVNRFSDFQHDVEAACAAIVSEGLPTPVYLVAHSMGGCIGLRALLNGLELRAVAFSAPMWGVRLNPAARAVAWGLTSVAQSLGFGHLATPGAGKGAYLERAAFQGNVLTTDPDMFAFMSRQIARYPGLALGAPSMTWLHEALMETRALGKLPSPKLPALTALGTNERVVEKSPIIDRMRAWQDGSLLPIAGAEHELLLERPAMRNLFFDSAAGLFVSTA